jgi:hypothetical protein
VDGNGNISFVGVARSSGASGGFNVTGDVSAHSIQTIGGVDTGVSSSGFGGYWINGVQVLDNNRNFVGATVTIGTGASLDASAAVSTGLNKINVYDGHLTSAKGVGAMYYTISSSGNTGNISTTQITYAGGTPSAGLYRISGAVTCVYGGSGSFTGNASLIVYTVPDGSFDGVGAAPLSINCGSGTYIQSFSLPVYTTGSSVGGCNGLCFSVSGSGFANGTYRVDMVAERLQ